MENNNNNRNKNQMIRLMNHVINIDSIENMYCEHNSLYIHTYTGHDLHILYSSKEDANYTLDFLCEYVFDVVVTLRGHIPSSFTSKCSECGKERTNKEIYKMPFGFKHLCQECYDKLPKLKEYK